jgi:hypothetical protein
VAVHIEFKTNRGQKANPSVVDPNQDLAGWLTMRLADTGLDAGAPTRHDWGFEIHIRAKGGEYYAGLPSRKDPGSNWHVIVEKRLSMRDRFLGRIMPETEPMALLIKEIIAREPLFKLVRFQEQH